jgi:hypothetical protein
MWWECSECGACVARARPPAVCRTCGVAGAIFVAAERGLELDPEADSLKCSWLLQGLARAAGAAAGAEK